MMKAYTTFTFSTFIQAADVHATIKFGSVVENACIHTTSRRMYFARFDT